VDDASRAEVAYDRALDLAQRLSNTPVIFLALAGRAVLQRLEGRKAEASDAAIRALELYLAGEPRRLANRVDPRADLLAGAAVCCTELGIISVEAGDAEHAVRLLGHADSLRTSASLAVPRFQCDGLQRALASAAELLAPAEFQAAFDAGRNGLLGETVPFKT